MITINSNIPQQTITLSAGGATSFEIVSEPLKDSDEVLLTHYPNVTVPVTGVSPEFEQRVTDVEQIAADHIANTTNPHQVQASQIPDGIDFTLLFNNALI